MTRFFQKLAEAFAQGSKSRSWTGAEDNEIDGIYPNRIYTNSSGHLDLYLKVQNRYWLVFVDNDTVTNDAGEEVSGGATYTPPQRIFNDGEGGEEDTLTTKPADPTWRGYEFVGWNTSPDGSGDWWLKYDTEVVTDRNTRRLDRPGHGRKRLREQRENRRSLPDGQGVGRLQHRVALPGAGVPRVRDGRQPQRVG